MAQRRLINRSLGSSRKFMALSNAAGGPTLPPSKRLGDFAQALYSLLIPNADDHGRMSGYAVSVKLSVFPSSPHPVEHFEMALAAMNRVGLITRYEVAGEDYLEINNFRREQPGIKWVAKSSCPAPSENGTKTPKSEVSKNQQLAGTRRELPVTGDDEKRREEILKRREEKRSEDPASLDSSAPRLVRGSPPRLVRGGQQSCLKPPPDSLPVSDALKDWASKHVPTLSVSRLTEETETMLDHYRGEGALKADWEATRRNWLKMAVKIDQKRNGGANGRSGGRPKQTAGGDRQGTGAATTGPAYSVRKR